MSNLVAHAKKELRLVGVDRDITESLLKVVQAFEDMAHSGCSASIAIDMLERLLRLENLTPITSGPLEWQYHTASVYDDKNGNWQNRRWIWQNRRNPKLFSEDGGVTYWSIEDKPDENGRRKMYESEPHPEVAKKEEPGEG